MRWVALAALLGAGGCGKRINPTWCQQPENQSVTECGNIADAKAQSMACTADPFCEGLNNNRPFCDTNDGVCVECLMGSQCPANLPACTDGACGACTQNSDCSASTDFCDQGICAQPSDAVIASPGGTGTLCGPDLSTPSHTIKPCDLLTGIAQAIQKGKVLRLVPDATGNRFTPSAPVLFNGNIRVTGEGTIIDGSLAKPTLQITGGQATFSNLELANMSGTAIECDGGSLTAKRLLVHASKPTSADPAFRSSAACTLVLDESVIEDNAHGALSVVSGDETQFLVHNSVFARNSNAPAVELNGKGHFDYNTVVENKLGNPTGGVTCAGGPTLDMNIIANNSPTTVIALKGPADAAPPPPPQQVGCDMAIDHGFIGYDVELAFLRQFPVNVNPFTAYHLTPVSPTEVVNIPNVICNNPALHDIDDTLRPAHNRCDMGADECSDCQQTSNQGHE